MDTENISARVIRVREQNGLSKAKFARKLGMKDHQIRDMERGKTSPTVEMIRRVVEHFQVDADWLIAGSGDMAAEKSPLYETPMSDMDDEELVAELRRRLEKPGARIEREPVLVWGDQSKVRQEEALGNFRAVPLMADAAAAGHGRVVEEEIESWAVIHSSVVPEGHEVRAVRVEGESMSPLLPEGTIVAVDFNRADPREADGRIVAARREGEVVVKWWCRHDGHIMLESQNPAWAPIYVEPGEEEGALLGQVVWAWQDLRQARRRH